jgi:DNA invertase Pin-like site-specific DNA recombinase
VPIETILLEMDKCEVICKNCHLIEHSCGERFYEFKDKIYERAKNYIEHNIFSNHLKVEKLKKMYMNGEIYEDIAKELNCNRSTIIRALNKLIKVHKIAKRKRKFKDKQKCNLRKIISLYTHGSTSKEIALKYNCSCTTILNIIKEERKNGRKILKNTRKKDATE